MSLRVIIVVVVVGLLWLLGWGFWSRAGGSYTGTNWAFLFFAEGVDDGDAAYLAGGEPYPDDG